MTEWNHFTINERFVRTRLEPKYGNSLDFEIGHRGSEHEIEPTPEFAGFVKWDGCCNFQAGQDIMVHICEVTDFDEIKQVFAKVYEVASMTIPGWDR